MKSASREPRLPGLPRTDEDAGSESAPSNASTFAAREREARAALADAPPIAVRQDAPDTVRLSAQTWRPPPERPTSEPGDDEVTDVTPVPPREPAGRDHAEVAGVIGVESGPAQIVDRPPPALAAATPAPLEPAAPLPGLAGEPVASPVPGTATPAPPPAFGPRPTPRPMPAAVPAPAPADPTLLVRTPARRTGVAVIAITALGSALLGLGGGYLLWGRTGPGGGAASPSAATAGAAASAPPTACLVRVESDPSGAAVLAGGERLGQTPLERELPCGEATLIVEHDRYQRLEKTVELRPDAPAELALELERPTHRFVIGSRPPGARVFVRGQPAGETPVTVEVPGFEKSKVVIKKRGFRPFARRIYSRDEEMTIRPRLRKRR